MTNRDRTEQYHSYFQDQLVSIKGLQNRLHKKILLVIILDTLSRARYPSVPGVKERFLKMVNKCAMWEHGNRVSLYRILLSLTPTKDSALREVANKSVTRWQDWAMPGIEEDPLLTEIEHLASSEEEKKLPRESTHSSLLYVYRNHLVHEFREPGHGMEMDQRDILPYYHRLTHLNAERENNETWELVYPLGFFMQIVSASLNNSKNHLLENDLNPYSFYKFGTIWKHKV